MQDWGTMSPVEGQTPPRCRRADARLGKALLPCQVKCVCALSTDRRHSFPSLRRITFQFYFPDYLIINVPDSGNALLCYSPNPVISVSHEKSWIDNRGRKAQIRMYRSTCLSIYVPNRIDLHSSVL